MSSSNSKQRGFTLLEVFSVVVVSGVLAMASMSLIQDYKQHHAAASIQQKFAETLTLARERAVGAGEATYVCASRDGKTCGGDWTDGWLVYQGGAAKQLGEAVQDEEVILQVKNEDVSIPFHVLNENFGRVAEIRFDNRGFNAAQQRLMALNCDSRSLAGKEAIFVERSGRVRIGKNSEDADFSCPQV